MSLGGDGCFVVMSEESRRRQGFASCDRRCVLPLSWPQRRVASPPCGREGPRTFEGCMSSWPELCLPKARKRLHRHAPVHRLEPMGSCHSARHETRRPTPGARPRVRCRGKNVHHLGPRCPARRLRCPIFGALRGRSYRTLVMWPSVVRAVGPWMLADAWTSIVRGRSSYSELLPQALIDEMGERTDTSLRVCDSVGGQDSSRLEDA